MDLFDLENIEIEVRIKEKDEMLAQVSLIYGDLIISGYRIMKSKYEDLFIQPPSIRTGGGNWWWVVKINNPTKWNDLKNRIKEEYKEAKKAHDEYKETELEEIDPDDIPI